MKKLCILLVVLFVVHAACQRSQFSTTTRHSKNGKVFYTNQYHSERIKSVKVKSTINHFAPFDVQIPISNADNLIASTSNEPILISIKENRVPGEENPHLSINLNNQVTNAIDYDDSIKMIAPKRGTTLDLSVQQVIRFKNGKKVLAGSICQFNDTLYFQLASDPVKTKIARVTDIDTIIQVRYTDPTTGNIADTREKEKLSRIGLIFSIVGIIPIIGLPFGITAIILGVVGLRKIKRQPERYRGEQTAKASIIIGILVTILSSIILIALAASGGPGQVSMGMGQ